MSRKKRIRVCLKCCTTNNITKHHVWPKRFFHGEGDRVHLCRFCHDELELMIPYEPKLSKETYEKILETFLELKGRVSTWLSPILFIFVGVNPLSPNE